jgi:hypothetical protein
VAGYQAGGAAAAKLTPMLLLLLLLLHFETKHRPLTMPRSWWLATKQVALLLPS